MNFCNSWGSVQTRGGSSLRIDCLPNVPCLFLRLSGWVIQLYLDRSFGYPKGSGMKIICRCCKGLFEPRANVRNQRYCSLPECQKARHLAWRPKEGVQTEEQIAAKKAAQKLWREKNPDYWKRYRKEHLSNGTIKPKNIDLSPLICRSGRWP